jgi:protein TonB
MPRDLFTSPAVAQVRLARRSLTVAGSTIAHVGVLAVLVSLPFVSGVSAPEIIGQLTTVVFAEPPLPPVEPASRVVSLAPSPVVSRVPISAPEVSEPERLVTAAAPVRPTGIVVGSVSTFGDVASSASVVLTAPPQPAAAPFHVGGNIRAPERVAFVAPVYPSVAQAAHIDGVVILEATIDESGAIRNLNVLKSIPLLDRAALDAVRQWRYAPTRLNGVAVPVIMTVTVTFTLKET